jgi:hypothetical protein
LRLNAAAATALSIATSIEVDFSAASTKTNRYNVSITSTIGASVHQEASYEVFITVARAHPEDGDFITDKETTISSILSED